MTDQEFLDLTKGRYGSRGLKQAKEWLNAFEQNPPTNLPASDLPAYRSLMMETWLDSKEEARKTFTPKKYRKDTAADAEAIMEGAVALF